MQYIKLLVLFSFLTIPEENKKELFEDAHPLLVGSRAVGMGNAYTAVSDDATAGFWNPAGLVQSQGVKIFGMNKFHNRHHYAFDPKGISYGYRSFAFFWGNKIALGTNITNADYNYYSLAHQIHSHIAVGGSIKFKRKRFVNFYQFFGYDPSYDLAILMKVKPWIKAGMVAQNFPGKSGIQMLTGGIAYQYNNFLFSLDTSLPKKNLYFGFEWTLIPSVHIRLGNSNQKWAFGTGYERKQIAIDYACISEERTKSHFISVEIKI